MNAQSAEVRGSFLRAGRTDHLVTGLEKLTDERSANRPGCSDDHDSHAASLLGSLGVRPPLYLVGRWLGRPWQEAALGACHIRGVCGVTHMTLEDARM